MLRVDRRTFLKASAGAGGALVLNLVLPGCAGEEAEAVPLQRDLPEGALAPNAFLRVEPDGGVLVMIPSSEMGQGVFTSLAMLVAEELGADWNRVRAEHAPAQPVYVNPASKSQTTGGSSSVHGFF
ncbi:MAG: molybdopterin cofactor-binding domain-containing protein, partial [Thiohalomonadaceae bacterium]